MEAVLYPPLSLLHLELCPYHTMEKILFESGNKQARFSQCHMKAGKFCSGHCFLNKTWTAFRTWAANMPVLASNTQHDFTAFISSGWNASNLLSCTTKKSLEGTYSSSQRASPSSATRESWFICAMH